MSVGLALLLSLGDGLAEYGEFGLAGGQLCLCGCEVGGLLVELFRARRLLSGVARLLFCLRLSVGLALLLSLGDGLAEYGEFGLVGGQLCLCGCEVRGLLVELFPRVPPAQWRRASVVLPATVGRPRIAVEPR